ncbi:glycosyl hydrolase 115 family protein [Desertivirga arenae]|uniref:glycosyl hydrolase 115 family protein n=1 Tax=Desertivirga arenae TaxID=2810309 RepID=UPI001A95887B|nr:glycosyl hydrolase 115 family protein [Pedobacter sp. SYSU D00823]
MSRFHSISLKIILGILFTGLIMQASAQVRLATGKVSRSDFSLIGARNSASLYYDQQDHEVVKRITRLFAEDIRNVSGKLPTVSSAEIKLSENSVIIGTLGSNRLIDKWAREGKIQSSGLKGKWESYLIQLVQNPAPGVKRALVIAGSDRRGTAFGVFSISEAIGVSPWYWWADAPVVKRSEISLTIKTIVSHEPSVKYRGIYVNDEDWGLLRWAKRTYDVKQGNIGPKTYAKVFELLLRLKANYLCPAMHEASTAFNKIPENKLLADSFAIVMGSVHAEPLLFNNASEWDKKTMGEWDYLTNKEGINKVLKERVRNNGAYENVYTLALRGIHDKAMSVNSSIQDRVKVLSNALSDQRQILTDVIGKPANQIPQAFTPYKEVLDIYSNGLELPEDVTIVWPDDNYGYIKRLSNSAERKRSGRSGVYYHVSYLGKPHDYLWLSSTPPALMYEELRKAYDTSADRLWLLNVGDIKSCEFPFSLFMDMAYDISKFDYNMIAGYHATWLSKIFGEQYYKPLLDITKSYYHLAFSRKPEAMGWGYEWNTNKNGRERTTDTDFSFANYQEAESRLKEYDRIGSAAEDLMNKLQDDQKASFYQLLYYPVKGAELMNKMHLNAQKNRWYARQQRSATNDLKSQVKVYYDSLQVITKGYNSLLDGKWNHMMSMVQGVTASYFELPHLDSIKLEGSPQLNVFAEGEDVLKGKSSFHALPSFSTYNRHSSYVDIYNSGKGSLNWNIKISDSWIITSKSSGTTSTQERIAIAVDWNKIPCGEKVAGSITISAAGKEEQVLISVFNPVSPSLAETKGLFIEDNGYISINAAGFHRKVENNDIKMKVIPGLGYEGASVQLGDPVAAFQNPASSTVPCLEYDFYTFDAGSVDVYTYALPTFPLSTDRPLGHETAAGETRYGVCINDGAVSQPSTSAIEYSQVWSENVLRNAAIKKSVLHINKPGKHTLKILCGDPGLIISKIVLDFGGMKRSYLGPPVTKSGEEGK